MKRFFHKGFYAEMMRQLKAAGIITAAILLASNLSDFLRMLPIFSSGDLLLSNDSFPTNAGMALPMMVYVYVAGLILTFIAFNWLNHRSYSDFYHALPVSRLQMYFSSTAAVLTWLAIGVTAFAAFHVLTTLLSGTPFNYLYYFCVYIHMLIGAVEVVGGVMIACSMSGTRFVNLFASAVIVFFPRFFLSMLSLFIGTKAPDPVSYMSVLPPLLDPSYNPIAVPYAMLAELISDRTYSVDFSKIPGMLWALAYALGLHALAAFAFAKRKSEAAGTPVMNRVFQGAIRTAIGMPMLIFVMMIILYNTLSDLFLFGFMLTLFAFIFYSLYELISTKSPKKMVRAMPLFIIPIGLSLLYLIIPGIIVSIGESADVSAQNIEGVYCPRSYSSYGSIIGITEEDYVSYMQNKVELKDPEIIAVIANAYERSLKDKFPPLESVWRVSVRIDRKKGGDINCELWLTEEETAKLEALKYSDPDYMASSVLFPKGINTFRVQGLTNKQARELGRIYEEEFEKLTDEQKLQVLYQNDVFEYAEEYSEDYEYENTGYLSLKVFTCVGVKSFTTIYRISELTPKALEYYLNNYKTNIHSMRY